MRNEEKSLGVLAADLPENSIRPSIDSTQSLQSFLQQVPHSELQSMNLFQEQNFFFPYCGGK